MWVLVLWFLLGSVLVGRLLDLLKRDYVGKFQLFIKLERRNLFFYVMVGKKVFIVYVYQEFKFFNGFLKNVVVDELSRQGCIVIVFDLYVMNFELRVIDKDIIGIFFNFEVFNYGVEIYEVYK